MGKEQEVRPCPFCSRRLIMKDPVLRYWVHPLETQADVDCAGSAIQVSDNPVRIAAWNRRSSDEQEEVVGWRPASEKPVAISVLARFMDDELGDWVYAVFDPPFYRLGEYTEWLPLSALSRPLYASPPAVAKGGVTAPAFETLSDEIVGMWAQGLGFASDHRAVVDLAREVEHYRASPTPPSRGEGV